MMRLIVDDLHSSLMFEAVRTMHLGIWKLQELFCRLHWLQITCAREGASVSVGRNFVSLNGGVRCACNLLLPSVEKELPVTGLPAEL